MSSFSALWRPEKAISADSLYKRFKGTYFRVSSFSAFWGMKMRFLPSRVNHCSRVLLLVWIDFLHFWDLKMWFFRDVKPTVQGNIHFYEFIFWILVCWKCHFWNTWCNFWRVIKPTVLGYMAFSRSFSAFWKPDNFYFWRVMIPTIQRNVLPCILAACKCYFYRVWRSCEPFVGILGTSEYDFCWVVISKV